MDGVVPQSATFTSQIKMSAVLAGPGQSIFVKLNRVDFILFDAGALTFWCFRGLDFHLRNPMFRAAFKRGLYEP